MAHGVAATGRRWGECASQWLCDTASLAPAQLKGSHDAGLREDEGAVALWHQLLQQPHHKHRLAGGGKACRQGKKAGMQAGRQAGGPIQT
jgi:hypothetical protein